MSKANELVYPTGMNAGHGGLTKRELFAALAMQGILSNLGLELNHLEKPDEWEPECLAKSSLRCADALLAELEKK